MVFSAGINVCHAQPAYDSAYEEAARRNAENLLVFTDRSLYSVSENIHFSAQLQSGGKSYKGLGSTVMYAELVNPAGTGIAKGKYLISNLCASGSISIPSNALTGTYYLRFYTRWMRNFGAQNFAYVPLRIVNPASGEVEVYNSTSEQKNVLPVPKARSAISVHPSRKFYQPAETVEIEFKLKEKNISGIYDACITVVPEGAIDTSGFLYRVESKPDEKLPFQFKHLPEINGISISGSVLQSASKNPAPGNRLHFSILGEDPAYFISHSDEQGRFLVNLPSRSGNQDMYVTPESQTVEQLEVLIDNDYSSEILPFHAASFVLSQDEVNLASRISLNMQLQKAFFSEAGSDNLILTNRSHSIPFYGKPEISIRIDDFVSLPNMKEVFENLIPMTFLSNKGGRTHLTIKNENPMISAYSPLILVDYIPIFDMDVILAIPPSKIDLIEVIPEVYIKGEAKYGGIISFTTLKGDLAGIKLPEGSYFFDYEAFLPALGPLRQRYTGPGILPDARNTLFWKTQVQLEKESSCKVSFKAASFPGTYVILFRGVSADGSLVHGMNRIEVE